MKNLIKVALCAGFAVSVSMAAPAFAKKPDGAGNGVSDAGGKVKCAISKFEGSPECADQ